MNTVKVNSGSTKMIAHRGVSGLEKENTNSAFVAAGNRSYFGIETDVHKTSDGSFVIIHDDETGRVCSRNMSVEGTDFATLRSLTLLDIDGSEGRSDLKIPTLAEYISICKKYGKTAVLELKNAFSAQEIYEMCEIIGGLGWLENTCFISFCLENLKFLREKYPTQAAQYLVSEYGEDLTDILIENRLDLDIAYPALKKEHVDLLHENGILINCWTVDNKEDADRLISWGVDYITSNILE